MDGDQEMARVPSVLEGRIAVGRPFTVPSEPSPDQPSELIYELWPPRRGRYKFGDLYLRWQGPLGLWQQAASF